MSVESKLFFCMLDCVILQCILALDERVDKAILSAPPRNDREYKSDWLLIVLDLVFTQEAELKWLPILEEEDMSPDLRGATRKGGPFAVHNTEKIARAPR